MVTSTKVLRHAGATKRLRLAVFLLATLGIDAFPSGPGGCSAVGGHGSPAQDGTTAGYTLTFVSGTVAPGERVSIALAAPSDGEGDYTGFIITADAGTLTVADAAVSRPASSCAGGVGHINNEKKAVVEVFLELPPTPGIVVVKAQV